MKKMMAMMLALVMVLGTLAGCSGGTTEDKKTTEAPEQTTAGQKESEGGEQTTEAPEQTTEAPKNEVTYPLENGGSLSFWIKNGLGLHGDFQSYTDSPFHTGLSTQTGVQIDWQAPAMGVSEDQAYNLLLQEEKLPHIIYGVRTAEIQELYDQGLIYDLTPYLEEYAPDYWEMINSDEAWLKEISNIEGRVLSFNFIRDEANCTYQGPAIRQDWLDECGLEMPETLEELENVLVKFKDKYGAYLGVQKAGMFNNLYGIVSGSGAMGFLGLDFYLDADRKVQCAQLQDEWKDFITMIKRWYDMGLIDPDFSTIKAKGSAAKVANDQIGVIVANVSKISEYVATAKANNSTANWVAMKPMRTEKGAPTTYIHYSAQINTEAAVITKSCSEEELITALKLLNYGYCEEGIAYYNYGVQGDTYTVDGNGDIWFSDKLYDDAQYLAYLNKYTGITGTGPAYQTARNQWLRSDEVGREGMKVWAENSVFTDYRIPNLDYTIEETDRKADLQTKIDTYASPVQMKFIIGEESLDNYDAYIQELYNLGIQDLIDLIQAAYDREYND